MGKPNALKLSNSGKGFFAAAAVLGIVLVILFSKSFRPAQVVFSNDGPLGVVHSEAYQLPPSFFGLWMDLVWIGNDGNYAPQEPTYWILALLGPINFAKFYPGLAVLISGLCAWGFFRTLRLGPALCTVAAIAAALNSNFFSNTCWGLGTRSIALAMTFLALAALNARSVGNWWLNAVLAGAAVGMAVVEGADIGVIFSLFIAAYVLWQSWVGRDDPRSSTASSTPAASTSAGATSPSAVGREGGVRGLPFGIVRLVLVAAFAGFMATQSLISLFDIASKTAVSAQADAETKEQKWAFATQWSLPPKETLRVLIPGLYGYRMDTPEGGNYWGRVGESPAAPGSRFSGAGEYAGVLVVLLAAWTIAQSFRRSSSAVAGGGSGSGFVGGPNGVFTGTERKMIWFWVATLVVATVLAWGKYAPVFYKVVYSLPYFSSIRNPMKFMHVSHLALMILFGYGLLGLSRRYLVGAMTTGVRGAAAGSVTGGGGGGGGAKVTTSASVARSGSGSGFEKGWTFVMVALLAVSVLGYMVYSSGKTKLTEYLTTVGFDTASGAAAKEIASFSIGEVGQYVLFLALSIGVLWAIQRGFFAGRRAAWAAVALGLVLTIDLVRANLPWVKYWDYPAKYATNPILDTLRAKPYEARVVAPPYLVNPTAIQGAGGMAYLFPQVYAIEWVQHHFQYYNIQSVDVAQDPRPPADKMAYMQAMRDPGRYWQLTNTRYVLGMTAALGLLNQQIDPGKNRFQVRETFTIAPKPGVTPKELQDLTAVTVPNGNGPLALFEFTGALPRARLYPQWQVSTNGDATLKTLTDPAFDPWATVIVSDPIPASTAGAALTNGSATAGGTVEFASYAPQRIELKANAAAPSVLLLNDRYDPDWRVTIDGQPATLLRANFIMRGVQVPAGQHTIVFTFKPSLTGLKVSLVAIAIALGLCVMLFFVRQEN